MSGFKLPAWATIVLTLLATVATVLNQAIFQAAEPWGTLITGGIAALAALGIGPLARGGLTTMLHVPYQVALACSIVFATAATSVTAIHGLSQGWKAALVGLLTALAGALTGPMVPQAPSTPVAGPATPHIP